MPPPRLPLPSSVRSIFFRRWGNGQTFLTNTVPPSSVRVAVGGPKRSNFVNPRKKEDDHADFDTRRCSTPEIPAGRPKGRQRAKKALPRTTDSGTRRSGDPGRHGEPHRDAMGTRVRRTTRGRRYRDAGEVRLDTP